MGVMYIRDENGKPIPIPGGSGGKPVVYPDWSHLTWYVMGDSLTAPGHEHTAKYYYEFIREKTGINIIVDGVGGTGYRAGITDHISFLERVQNAFPTEQEMKEDQKKKEAAANLEIDKLAL